MSSPEDLMRKMYLRWANFRLAGAELQDLRDLFRTERLVTLTEAVLGEKIEGANPAPRLEGNHEDNISLCVNAIARRTSVEWGADKLIKGVQSKQLGYLEILCWHLVEVGLLLPLGLPCAHDSLGQLAKAIEARLSKFIKLKQFHFRYTKEMIFDIVHDCSSWQPDTTKNDVQNLRSAFDNMAQWGIPLLVDPPDVRQMGSVNERGFLMFFAMFIPSLEGTVGPKRKASVTAVSDTSALDAELVRLQREVERLEQENQHIVEREVDANQRNETLSMKVDDLAAQIAQLQAQLAASNVAQALEDELAQLRSAHSNCAAALEQCARDGAAAAALHAAALQERLAASQAQARESAAVEAQQQAQLDACDVELARLEAETARLNALLAEGQSSQSTELVRLRGVVAEREQASAQLTARNAELEAQLQDAGAQRALLDERLAASASDVGRLTAELEERDAQLQRGAAAAAEALLAGQREADADVAALRAEADVLRQRIASQDFDGLEAKFKRLLADYGAVTLSLTDAKTENEALLKSMRLLELKMPLFARQGNMSLPPPTGDVTLCFTDVEGSTVQWEWDADAMALAIRVHNDLMRKRLFFWKCGYEVKTEGDAFMVAFSDPLQAVSWCLDTQQALLEAPWPDKLFEHEKSKVVQSGSGALLYKGLRVRMGIHCGRPSAEEDPVTGRMDYFGPMVNRSARVESVAHGGQIVMSKDVYDRVRAPLESSEWRPEFADLGSFELKGLNDATHIFQVLPGALRERQFTAVVSKEAELAGEKMKLEQQLLELRSKNDELAQKLQGIDADVACQMSQAKRLLEDVQAAKLTGLPPAEMLATLRQELSRMLADQTATSTELQRAKAVNDELFRHANEVAQRREQIAVQSMALEKDTLEHRVGMLKHELEQQRAAEAALRAELAAAQQTAATSGPMQKELDGLRSLQMAMAARIEQLEVELEQAGARALQLGAVMKQESDRWADEERDLKKTIRSLEQRVAKRKSSATKATHDSRLEVLALKASVRTLEDQLGMRGGSGAPSATAAATASHARPASKSPSASVASAGSSGNDTGHAQSGVCGKCKLPIDSGETVTALGKTFHDACFVCVKCGGQLRDSDRMYAEAGEPVHERCRK